MLSLVLGACGPAPRIGANRLAPSDFQSQGVAPRQAVEHAPSTPTEEQETIATSVISQPVNADEVRPLTVDSNVGQIFGRPVYASEVFKEIGEDVLRRIGTEATRLAFRDEVAKMLGEALMQRVDNRLMLAEAENALSENEQLGLAGYLRQVRERLIARYGGGVLALADQTLLKEQGRNLQQQLERERELILLRRYYDENVKKKVHVPRREVERYFVEHDQEFNPPPQVNVRIIMVRDARAADAVEADLAAGVPFADIAKKHSIIRQAEGGLLDPFGAQLSEFNALGSEDLNNRVRGLSVGQHSERVQVNGGRFAWVMLDSIVSPKGRKLEDVFLEIERQLHRMKEDRLQREMIADLRRNGNYTPLEDMLPKLIEVAMARFARAQ